MKRLGITTLRGAKWAVAGLALAAILGIAQACIVSDQDLPCRGDCECPSGQYCNKNTCKTTQPARNPGDVDGPCNGDGTCSGTLLCTTDDVCGERVCRTQCSRLSNTTGCTGGHVCQDVRTGAEDAGLNTLNPDGGLVIVGGVCVP